MTISVPDAPAETGNIVSHFLRDRLDTSGCKGFVLGLSGGLDSALVLRLAVDPVGPGKVHPVFLPNGPLSSPDRQFAMMAADVTGCELKEIDIAPLFNAFPVRKAGIVDANLQARLRMSVLYSIANRDGLLVLGTSNKTELMLGYFTKFGDGGSDLCPIGDLLKTQVRSLASKVGVPREIIDRPPTAGLVKGQTDEGEIRMPYPVLDRIIIGYLRGYDPLKILEGIDITVCSKEELSRSGIDRLTENDVRRIVEMIDGSRHKRDPLIIPKIGSDTIGIDLRERW
jgi:NAD+ synthase